jgi:5,10-methylenetetrahydromethanopterin reductase
VALCVTNFVTRHPAVSAAAIASLDQLAPGRAVLGVGVGHSGTRNLGAPSLPAGDLAEGVAFVKTLLRGQPASYRGAPAHLPWVKRPSPVFLAASHPRAEAQGLVTEAARAGGRRPEDVEIWQIACLDCHDDGDAARRKVGAILAFVAAYVMGGGDLGRRGVPAKYHEPLRELRRRYSTRPGDADAALVAELGLFDYLARRLAVCGTPAECLVQVRAAQAAGVERLMFTVSLATDPVRTVERFGELLPRLRNDAPAVSRRR